MHLPCLSIHCLSERLLVLLVDDQDAEALLGDFSEEYCDRLRHMRKWEADAWYAFQLFRSAGPLLWLRSYRWLKGRVVVKNNPFHNRLFWFSLLGLIPALLLVIPGLFQSGFGITSLNEGLDATFGRFPLMRLLINPILLLGGLIAAFALNLITVIGLHWESAPQGLIATLTLKKALRHWLLVGASMLLMGILLVYGFVENFILLPR